MDYRIFDHTADLGVEVTGATLEELYAGAAFALFDLLTDLSSVRAGGRARSSFRVRIRPISLSIFCARSSMPGTATVF